jgi:hypothetical protein
MKRTTFPSLAALLGAALASGAAHQALADPPRTPAAAAAPAKKSPQGQHPLPEDTAPKEPTREERIEQARQLFLAADEKLKAGDFAGALAGFRASNDVVRTPQTLLRIALCVEKVGTRAEAEEAFHRFLGLPPPESMVEERHLAEEHLAGLGAGTLKVSSRPSAITVEVDGKPGMTTPLELRLPPGKHVVRASAPEYEPSTDEIEITRGGVMDLAVALRSLPPPAPAAGLPSPVHAPPAPATGSPSPTLLAGVAFGLAAVGVGVGTAFGVRAFNARSEFDQTPTQALADQQKTSAVISDSALGSAIVCTVVGAVFITHRRAADPPPSARLQLVPVLSPQAQGAAALFRF